MKIMIDTNVLLDCMLDRKPFSEDAQVLLEQCARGEYEGCILSSTITDVFYIARKSMKDLHQIYLLMDDFMEDMLLIGVQNGDVMDALGRREPDFEDCLLSICAEKAKCDFIITRNVKDFKNSNVSAITPREFMKLKS